MGCSGASGQEKNAQASQQNFASTLMNTFKTAFAQSQQVLSTIIPQLQAMATNPEGFGVIEYAALQSQIVNSTGAAYSSAAKQNALEFATTNEAGLPSGVEEQVQASTRAAAAGAEAQQSTGLAIANEKLKQQQQQFALGSLGQVASLEGSEASAAAGTATSGQTAAFNEAKTISDQGSLWQNILQGVVGAGLSFATGGLSSLAGGGASSGGGSGMVPMPMIPETASSAAGF